MAEMECYSCGAFFEESDGENIDGYWYCDDCTTPIDCKKCECEFTISEFAHIDDEYDEYAQLCPACSAGR
ncbi:hypothetical protein [Desulfobacter curvatus]|uniref:hypothetical protein n=1 Tax=Desulfobacter curvatus TaxID=2290 RepID=UPI00037034DC|nr:hypothetical protein [Desulfobacter curvatus]